jgi:hypothetical protein
LPAAASASTEAPPPGVAIGMIRAWLYCILLDGELDRDFDRDIESWLGEV